VLPFFVSLVKLLAKFRISLKASAGVKAHRKKVRLYCAFGLVFFLVEIINLTLVSYVIFPHSEGQSVHFKNVNLPKGKFVKLQPVDPTWLELSPDERSHLHFPIFNLYF